MKPTDHRYSGKTKKFRGHQSQLSVTEAVRGYLAATFASKQTARTPNITRAAIKDEAVSEAPTYLSVKRPEDLFEKPLDRVKVEASSSKLSNGPVNVQQVFREFNNNEVESIVESACFNGHQSITPLPSSAIQKLHYLRDLERHVYQETSFAPGMRNDYFRQPTISQFGTDIVETEQRVNEGHGQTTFRVIPLNQPNRQNIWQEEAWINHLAVTAQFDTRATNSFIKQAAVHELMRTNRQIEVQEYTGSSIHTTSSEVIPVIGQVHIDLTIRGKKCPAELLIVNSLPIYLVLGMDFLKTNSIFANFGVGFWIFKDDVSRKFPFTTDDDFGSSSGNRYSRVNSTAGIGMTTQPNPALFNGGCHRANYRRQKDAYSYVRDHQIKRKRDKPWKRCYKCGGLYKRRYQSCSCYTERKL